MANTNMDYLYPEFWAAGFDALDVGEYNLQNLVSRDVEAQLAQHGDTVNVPITPDFGDAAEWTPGSNITPSGTTQSTVVVSLDKSRQQVRGFNDKELTMSKYKLIDNYAAPMAKSILTAVNKDLYLEMLKTPYFVDATSNIALSHLADARSKLSKNEVGLNGRNLVGSPDMIGALMKLSDNFSAAISGDNRVLREGVIDRRYGFDIYENNVISKYTPADVGGALVHTSEFAAGTTTVVVNGFDDDSKPIRVGDMFKIADETGTPWHTVLSTKVTSGDTTEITFTPPLASACAKDKVVTITPTQSLLAFVPGAVAFAARPYAATPKPGVNATIVDVRGLPVRISTWTDSLTLNLNVAYDILYGCKMVNNKRIVRILEDA